MSSKMWSEAISSPQIISKQLEKNLPIIDQLISKIDLKNITNLLTVARGSSDHATHFLGYLAEMELGLLHTTLSMSLITVHGAHLKTSNSLILTISQSGKSLDLINSVNQLSKNTFSIGLINQTDSPLAKTCTYCIGLEAGVEESVAATKSFLSSLSCGIQLLMAIKNNKADAHLEIAPLLLKNIDHYLQKPWHKLIEHLKDQKNILVISRGLGFSISLEMSLKFKEVCQIQAECFSSAEVQHGPQALIDQSFTVLFVGLNGPHLNNIIELKKSYQNIGAHTFLIGPENCTESDMSYISSGVEYLDAMAVVQIFYLFAENLAQKKGLSPDSPPHLKKITITQ